MEEVINEGAEALNAYIDSGEIEELSDLILGPKSDDSNNEDNIDEPESKRSKTIKNHNAQIIYKNIDSNPMIPSLMTINVPPVNESGQPVENWNASANYNANPPSLLNLNVAPPPFDDSASGNWSGRNDFNNRNSKPEGTKRRNRDSEGNRISRFDRERPSRFDNNNDSTRNVRRNTRRI